MPSNFYDILRVSPEANADEIGRAYRQSALQNHPDLGGDVEVMTELNRAYEVLRDPEQRALYDQFLAQDDAGSLDRTGEPHGPEETGEAFEPPIEEEPGAAITALRLLLRLADATATLIWRVMASDSIPWLLCYGLVLLLAGSLISNLSGKLRLP